MKTDWVAHIFHAQASDHLSREVSVSLAKFSHVSDLACSSLPLAFSPSTTYAPLRAPVAGGGSSGIEKQRSRRCCSCCSRWRCRRCR
ncbi:hypothetical protein ZIOFF_069088 [Zingiber officinale]|uniref:Uncharacterized protein n=1 Tax=Zingiber officinale TaxID=94328 RepID=A0A8J5CBA4_ZINOF|nr:hypothetical protein ZIOFF_069088 [Zingiber officinale]